MINDEEIVDKKQILQNVSVGCNENVTDIE